MLRHFVQIGTIGAMLGGCALELNDYRCSSDDDCAAFGRVCVDGACALQTDDTSGGDTGGDPDASDTGSTTDTDVAGDTTADAGDTTDADTAADDAEVGDGDTANGDGDGDVDIADTADGAVDSGADADVDADIETGADTDAGDVAADAVADADVTLNVCGGTTALAQTPGDACGVCLDGLWACDGVDALRCDGPSELNECGGCAVLDGELGGSCGVCGGGELACDGDDALWCVDDGSLNACGGCAVLDGLPDGACGPCGDGAWQCAGEDSVECMDASELNSCGGCGTLVGAVGDACGTCGGGELVCNDALDGLDCEAPAPVNACGGCDILEGEPLTACGTCGDGQWSCSVDNGSVSCVGATTNDCGGCEVLSANPGATCGVCGDGSWTCDGNDDVTCNDPGPRNSCGGCASLPGEPGTSCGTCGNGEWECNFGGGTSECVGATTNLCGGCATLSNTPGSACGDGGQWVCAGADVACDGERFSECDSAADCPGSSCSNGRCVPGGWAYIPAGTFIMGSPESELGRSIVEGVENQHIVALSRPFLLQTEEVSRGDWTALGATPTWGAAPCGDHCPASGLSWWDAALYANALSRAEGLPECYVLEGCGQTPGAVAQCNAWGVNAPHGNSYLCAGYRLPTEAEWEYAYRGGTTTAFYSGGITDATIDGNADLIGHYAGNGGAFRAGGLLAPNVWGIFDMAGNVWEWTDDDYSSFGPDTVDPMHPSARAHTSTPVRRGGGATSGASSLRGAARSWQNRESNSATNGVRIARTVWPTTCTNTVSDLDETGIDCGGPCQPCERYIGDVCQSDDQCTEGYCSQNVCTPDGFVTIEPGAFSMGSPLGELAREADEQQHLVTLTRRFWMATTEVTQTQFTTTTGIFGQFFVACGGDCPMERISWFEALTYANAVNLNSGLASCVDHATGVLLDGATPYECEGYRLPTEAEWEYAFRAGTSTEFYTGSITNADCADSLLNAMGWYCGNAGGTTHPVGLKDPNPYGLFDMAGNVFEWVHDGYDVFTADPLIDPVGLESSEFRGFRGGALNTNAHFSRAASRMAGSPSDSNQANLGFRLARTVPE